MVGDKMKVIDFEKRGNNIIRYYFGDDDCNDYWGDGWGDVPYDNNAQRVNNKYIKKYIDIAYPFDYLVLTPDDIYLATHSIYPKWNMKYRIIPCVIIIDKKLAQKFDCYNDFEHWVWVRYTDERIKKVYFGDSEESVKGDLNDK